jgi:hypothetical protein
MTSAVALILTLPVTWSAAAADKAAAEEALEPWASNRHPKDVAAKHAEDITAAKQEYRVKHGGDDGRRQLPFTDRR